MRWYLTARDTDARLTEQRPLRPGPVDAGLPVLAVDTRHRFQTIEGFGGAFTEAAALNWLALSEARRAEVLEAYFDRAKGHGYSLCRVHMGSCDFALGNYAHVETPEDFRL
ncbi:MAG TPA: hypothetical protein VMT50_00725, partial [Steroidobacteraceae bacterium]|nr:hypothetical protein [Steroidobacteraceae bacterium]